MLWLKERGTAGFDACQQTTKICPPHTSVEPQQKAEGQILPGDLHGKHLGISQRVFTSTIHMDI